MTFIKLPRIGNSTAAAEKDEHPEPAAFANGKKVIQVLDAVEDWEIVNDLVVDDAPFTCQADALGDCKVCTTGMYSSDVLTAKLI